MNPAAMKPASRVARRTKSGNPHQIAEIGSGLANSGGTEIVPAGIGPVKIGIGKNRHHAVVVASKLPCCDINRMQLRFDLILGHLTAKRFDR
jgi:hypothetical protein